MCICHFLMIWIIVVIVSLLLHTKKLLKCCGTVTHPHFFITSKLLHHLYLYFTVFNLFIVFDWLKWCLFSVVMKINRLFWMKMTTLIITSIMSLNRRVVMKSLLLKMMRRKKLTLNPVWCNETASLRAFLFTRKNKILFPFTLDAKHNSVHEVVVKTKAVTDCQI